MGTTRIFVTPDSQMADQTAGFWRGVNGCHVAIVRSTDACEVDDIDGGGALWEATEPGPLYVVIATPDALTTATKTTA